jgi:preprotein translocase subunit YajC
MQNLVLNVLSTPVLAQQTPAPGGGGSLLGMLPLLLMLGGMFFLMTASQRKKQKEHQKMINALATGDEILTSGGIYGVVTNVKPDRIVVKVAEGTKIEVGRSFVQAVEKKSAAG